MVKSPNLTVCSKASTGGALVLLPVMGEPCLSRYDNILWMMAQSHQLLQGKASFAFLIDL
jgi:hypothetical protein